MTKNNSSLLSNLPLQQHQEEDEIDLLQLIHTVLNGKWLILFFTITSSIIAFIYAHGQPPIYKADALLRVESERATIPNIEDLVGLSRNDNAVGTEIEMLKSRKIVGKAVEDLKLDIQAYPKQIRIFSTLHKRLFSPTETEKLPLIWDWFDRWARKYAWGNEQIQVDYLKLPKEWNNKSLTLRIKQNNTFELIYDNKPELQGAVDKTSVSKDKLISIFVSKLTGLPGTEFVVRKSSKRIAINSLKNRISAEEKGYEKYYTGMIQLSLTGSDENKIKKILDKITITYVDLNKSRGAEEATNALKFLQEQIKPVEAKVREAEANLEIYRTKNQTANLPQETQSILDAIVAIDAELQKFALTKDELRQKFTEQHPKFQAIRAQEDKLKLSKKNTQGKIAKLPKAQQTLFKLERDIKVTNAIYVDLLNKIQEFKIAKASTVGNAYIVDNAEIDDSYSKPNRRMIIAVGTLVGILLGLFTIFLRQALRHTINNPDRLEKDLGIPVYATVPLSKNVKLTGSLKAKHRKQKSLLALENVSDPAIEALRSLRTSLHFALHEAKNNIVMITGPSPYIGKSFISSNFSVVAASSGQRVIIVDADMRKGYLHKLTDFDVSPGLSDLITDKASLEDTIQSIRVGDDSLDLITRGQTPPNPSELLMHDNFSKLLRALSKRYDLVIIDSPPIHAVTDPMIVGSHAGVVFMVVHSDKHTMEEIEQAVSRLSLTGIETKGIVFNGYVPTKSRYGYGYRGYDSYYGEYK